MAENNIELAKAFPAALRDEALIALGRFPAVPDQFNRQVFTVRVAGDELTIRERLYHDVAQIDSAVLPACKRNSSIAS